MRLGLRPTVFEPGTEAWCKARKLYGGAGKIWERHRHRYEVNPEYVERLQTSGLCFTGKDEKGERMQMVELPGSSYSTHPDKMYWHAINVLLALIRSSVLPGPPSTSRVLHPTSESISSLPRFCGRFIGRECA